MIFVWVVTKPIPVVIMSSNEDLFLSVPRQICVSPPRLGGQLSTGKREIEREGETWVLAEDSTVPVSCAVKTCLGLTPLSCLGWCGLQFRGREALKLSCQSDIANMNQRPAYQKVISLLWSICSKSQVCHCEIQSEIFTQIIIDIVNIVYLRNKAEPWYLCYCLTQK